MNLVEKELEAAIFTQLTNKCLSLLGSEALPVSRIFFLSVSLSLSRSSFLRHYLRKGKFCSA